MQRMRSGRCDAGVPTCSGQTVCRDRWKIIAMDQVMRDAGMVGLLSEYLFQDFRRFQLVRIGLIGWKSSNIERERVEYRCFGIFGIALGQPFHRLHVGQRPSPVIYLVPIFVEGLNRTNIATLALGLGV